MTKQFIVYVGSIGCASVAETNKAFAFSSRDRQLACLWALAKANTPLSGFTWEGRDGWMSNHHLLNKDYRGRVFSGHVDRLLADINGGAATWGGDGERVPSYPEMKLTLDALAELAGESVHPLGEASQDAVDRLAAKLGLAVLVENGAAIISNHAASVYHWHDLMNGAPEQRAPLKRIIESARNGEAGELVELDVHLEALENGAIGVSSFALHCEYPVAPAQVQQQIDSLAQQLADLLAADGSDAGVKVIRQINDPQELLGRSVAALPQAVMPAAIHAAH